MSASDGSDRFRQGKE